MISQSTLATYLVYEFLTVGTAAVLGVYLKWELASTASLKRHWPWLAAALVLQLIGETIYAVHPHGITSDFLLHSLTGGIICICLFYYLVQTFTASFQSWRLELLAFFAFVSTFGVLNELMEFALDSLGQGPFSSDRLDTWRDLTANTVGGLVFWIVLRSTWRRKSR